MTGEENILDTTEDQIEAGFESNCNLTQNPAAQYFNQ